MRKDRVLEGDKKKNDLNRSPDRRVYVTATDLDLCRAMTVNLTANYLRTLLPLQQQQHYRFTAS